MEESDTYWMIIEEEEVKRAKEVLILLGEVRSGRADEVAKMQLERISDLERLRRMILRATTAANWQEILDTR